MLTTPSDIRTACDAAAPQGIAMSGRQQSANANEWLFCRMAGNSMADNARNALEKRRMAVVVSM